MYTIIIIIFIIFVTIRMALFRELGLEECGAMTAITVTFIRVLISIFVLSTDES